MKKKKYLGYFASGPEFPTTKWTDVGFKFAMASSYWNIAHSTTVFLLMMTIKLAFLYCGAFRTHHGSYVHYSQLSTTILAEGTHPDV